MNGIPCQQEHRQLQGVGKLDNLLWLRDVHDLQNSYFQTTPLQQLYLTMRKKASGIRIDVLEGEKLTQNLNSNKIYLSIYPSTYIHVWTLDSYEQQDTVISDQIHSHDKVENDSLGGGVPPYGAVGMGFPASCCS